MSAFGGKADTAIALQNVRLFQTCCRMLAFGGKADVRITQYAASLAATASTGVSPSAWNGPPGSNKNLVIRHETYRAQGMLP